VGFRPFYGLYLKGLKTHRGTDKAGTITYPSAEADGKRESAARGLLHLMRDRKEAGGIGNP